MKQISKQLPSLDAAKWVSALLMVVIHTQPFRHYSEIVDFLTARVIAPVGISVFFCDFRIPFRSKVRNQRRNAEKQQNL